MPEMRQFSTADEELRWVKEHNQLPVEELDQILNAVSRKWARRPEPVVIVRETVTTWKGPAVGLRFRKLFFGAPVLQQEWLGQRDLPDGRREIVREWRDVPVETVG